ncbi:MAG TPA: flagellar hook-associated protein FlgL [Humidesulfovibrio sp.]|uniref:flagellar hook-associated protein FlgL n=1 Tax=Humidesulfovibrio sp. TaxID=2910988 RepID=UPI002CF49EEB|nr:flagellar hook-associated protein FlgL [Humidesulfovibrio sp.]HWR04756.1 flagellar hook-associated protein FlgL [Humidesulfovibrio sp.]
MLRVSTQMMYTQSTSYINNKLATLTDLNEQSSSQKRVNKPSDDAVGMATILNLRTTLKSYDQYAENVATAQGWLSSSDSTLTQVSTLLTRAKELAQEASTGTVSDENRTQISYEMRQIYEQLIALANTKYQNKSIYAGQATDQNAFSECLWMTSNDASLSASNSFRIEGNSATTVLVQFVNSGASTGSSALMSACDVRYSIDGGKTFLNGSLASNAAGEMVVSMPESGTSITFAKDTMVKANSMTDTNDTKGTWMWIRPSAIYNGDDADPGATTVSSTGLGTNFVSASARGSFSANALVRIDNPTAVAMDGDIQYSYSLDNGTTWVTGNTVAADTTASNATLNIANGGLLTLTSNGSNMLQPGAQFLIKPNTANVSLQISASETLRVNDVGKDIFGGIYQNPQKVLANGGARLTVSSSNAAAVFDSSSGTYTSNGGNPTKNLFETMGNLVAFLETNNQQGVSQALESLKLCQTQITTSLASVGGRENRAATTKTILTNLTDSVTSQLSSVEDVDLTKLLTQLSQQETAYQAVLKSSSMIMQMSLMNYL